MAILKADKTTTVNGVKVYEHLLTKHNPNKIEMPTIKMSNIVGITVHNTDWLNTTGTTPAEQYTRATVNGNMKDVRVHYYVDDTGAWQNLPLDLSGWHAADGSGNGNRKTIAIECIMKSSTDTKSLKSRDNCARLAAYLLYKHGLGINCLYTHTHWLNVKDGRKGTVDQLNTMKNPYKMCPAYILPNWDEFKALVNKYLKALKEPAKPIVKEALISYKVKKDVSALNIRSSAGTDKPVIKKLKAGDKISVVKNSEKTANNLKWYKVKLAGAKYGYVASQYIEKA